MCKSVNYTTATFTVRSKGGDLSANYVLPGYYPEEIMQDVEREVYSAVAFGNGEDIFRIAGEVLNARSIPYIPAITYEFSYADPKVKEVILLEELEKLLKKVNKMKWGKPRSNLLKELNAKAGSVGYTLKKCNDLYKLMECSELENLHDIKQLTDACNAT